MEHERFYNIAQFPFEKTKEFMRQLYDIKGSWTFFDVLDCSVSHSRKKDSSTTFEDYLANANPRWITAFIAGRKEYHPNRLEEVTTISMVARNNLNQWRIPELLEDVLRKTYGNKLYNWEFFGRKNLVPEAYPLWKKLNKYKGEIKLPESLSRELPSTLREQLPDDLKPMIREDTERVERFYWWHCPYNKMNYAKVSIRFMDTYGRDLQSTVLGAK